jgi:translation initiation factor 3 subunit I
MRPLLLKGGERPVTDILFNTDGDLLFSASKDNSVTVWLTDSGERIGTYDGHTGAVWTISVDRKSTRLLSGAADSTVRLWEVETGKHLHTWKFERPVRVVSFAPGDAQFFTITDQVMNTSPVIEIFDLPKGDAKAPRSNFSTLRIETPHTHGAIYKALWGPKNETIITACVDGTIKVYETSEGNLVKTIQAHQKSVQYIQYDKWGTTFISASKDGYAKLWDPRNLVEPIKVYDVGRPMNAAAISPLMDHIIVGGGESAGDVTLTQANTEQFKVRFFHTIFQEELGNVLGHFGPVHCLAFSPDGRSFASAGEDGFVRLHNFDEDYFKRTEDITTTTIPNKSTTKK